MENTMTQKEMGAQNKNQHWIFLDVCKVVAVFFIVIMHVSAGAWGQAPLGSFDWHSLNVYNSLSRIGMPLFFMQVGAVLLSESNDISIKDLYKKYIIRIGTAFLFWSAFYMFVYYWLDAPGGFNEFSGMSFFSSLISGAPHSQWFILLAITMYLIIPLMRVIANNEKACKYFLILWLVFSFLLPTVYRIPAVIMGTPDSVQDVIIMIADSISRVRPGMIVDYPGYLLLGYFVHNRTFTKKETIWIGLLGLGGLAYTVLMTVGFSLNSGSPTESFLGTFSINIGLMSLAMMVCVKALIKKIWFSQITYKGLRFFSNVSLGIFLIHDFLRMGLVRWGIETLSFLPLLSVPVLSVVVFALSGAIAYWLKNIPMIGSYIVGD